MRICLDYFSVLKRVWQPFTGLYDFENTIVSNTNNVNTFIRAGVLVLFLASFTLLVAMPIHDPDFFWHLSTGKWIYEQRAVPSEDPFNFTTPQDASRSSVRTTFILQSYWLGQLLIFAVYSLGNYIGVVLFMSLLFLLILVFLSIWLRGKGLHVYTVIMLLLVPAYILGEFVGARPNQMSFLMAVIALYLVEETRTMSKKAFFLPPVIALWSNIHGGFILGVAMIFIYMTAETVIKLYRSYQGEAYRGYFRIMLIFFVSILFGFMNPQGYNVLLALKETSAVALRTISEHQTPFTIMKVAHTYIYVGFTVLCVFLTFVHIVLSLKNKKLDLAHTMLLLSLIVLSLTSIRFIPFLALFMTPVISGSFGELLERPIARTERFGIVQCFLCILLVAALYIGFDNTVFKKPVLSEHFPVRAVAFLKEQEIEGNIFNFLDFGGYIDWALYPEKKTFIDGRNLVNSVYESHDTVMRRLPGWDTVLDSYKVKTILIPPVTRTGGIFGLTLALYKDERWRLVYGDSAALVFSKSTRAAEIPKLLVPTYIITAATKQTGSDNPVPYLSIAQALTIQERTHDAIIFLENSIRQRPSLSHTEAGAALKRLKAREQETPYRANE